MVEIVFVGFCVIFISFSSVECIVCIVFSLMFAVFFLSFRLLASYRSKQPIVTIQRFGAVLKVIPSKQRPRKLMVYGGDGNEYPFLLKGDEDLRCAWDERDECRDECGVACERGFGLSFGFGFGF
jgi:hypothetical protein